MYLHIPKQIDENTEIKKALLIYKNKRWRERERERERERKVFKYKNKLN